MKMLDVLKEDSNRDIVITIPSTIKWDDYLKEIKTVEDGSQQMNFKVSKLPVNTSVGCKCFLCYKGSVIGWMKISGYQPKDKLVKEKLDYFFKGTTDKWNIPQELPFLKEFLNDVEELCNQSDTDSTNELLHDIITWEKDLSVYDSLESILKNKYIVLKR